MIRYFTGMDREKCPFLKVPLNHVVELVYVSPIVFCCCRFCFFVLNKG